MVFYFPRVVKPQDYREILKQKFDQSRKRNPRFSLRAFSKKIGLSSSQLTEVLQGRHGLSPLKAGKIADALGMSTMEKEYFTDLVQSLDGRSEAEREIARIRLQKNSAEARFQQVPEDCFRVIAEWYHFAILELTEVETFRPDVSWVAHALRISEDEAQAAIQRLARMGYLEMTDGKWISSESFRRTTRDVPSDAIRKFHSGVLRRALEALESQPVEQREFISLVMAIDSQLLPEAKKRLREFETEFCMAMNAAESKDRVYSLCMQFFELARERG